VPAKNSPYVSGAKLLMTSPVISSIKSSLRGCLEVSSFLARGFDRFDATLPTFKISFLVPLLMVPLNIPVASYETEFQGMPLTSILIAMLYRGIVSLFFFLGGVWLLTWILECRHKFLKFGIVTNWLNVTGFVLMLPYLALLVFFGFTPEELGHLILVIVAILCAIVAFTARHTLKVNWPIAILISIYLIVSELLAAYMLWA